MTLKPYPPIFVLLWLFSVSLPLHSYPYTEIVVFGDSLSDTGRFLSIFDLTALPFFSDEGHASNGDLWVQYLAKHLNMDYHAETNFAQIGATTRQVQTQVDDYIVANLTADPTALYVVWAGANDFLGASSFSQTKIMTAVTNLTTAIKKLVQQGAKQILVPYLPDLGKTPTSLKAGNTELMTEISVAFNQSLVTALQDVKLIQINMPLFLEKIIQSPAPFENVTEACLNYVTPCDNPANYLFWHNAHPTTVGHEWIALAFYMAIAEPSYQLNTINQQWELNIPLVASPNTNQLFFNLKLNYHPEITLPNLTVEQALAIDTTLQEMIRFSGNHRYPQLGLSNHLLKLPIVHFENNQFFIELQLDLTTTSFVVQNITLLK